MLWHPLDEQDVSDIAKEFDYLSNFIKSKPSQDRKKERERKKKERKRKKKERKKEKKEKEKEKERRKKEILPFAMT